MQMPMFCNLILLLIKSISHQYRLDFCVVIFICYLVHHSRILVFALSVAHSDFASSIHQVYNIFLIQFIINNELIINC